MKIYQIATVAKSNDGTREYGMTAAGLVFFPRTKDIKLVKGQFAIVDQVEQTMTYGADGETLVKLEKPIINNIAVSVWDNKDAARNALHEDSINDIEDAAFLESLKAQAVAKFKPAKSEAANVVV